MNKDNSFDDNFNNDKTFLYNYLNDNKDYDLSNYKLKWEATPDYKINKFYSMDTEKTVNILSSVLTRD